MTQTAIIVGAGIAGLATARGLEDAGWSVRVLEEAPDLRTEGAGVSITKNGMAALDELGVGGKVRGRAVRSLPQGVSTDQGVELVGAFQFRSSSVWGIARGELLEILRGGRDIEFGRRVIGAADASSGRASVTVEQAPGAGADAAASMSETIEADLIVGADGIDSKVRAALWPKVRPDYSGATCWRGVAPSASFGPGGARQYLGRGAEFGTLPIGGDRIYWWGMSHARLGGAAPDEASAALDRFATWAPEIGELIGATPAADVFRHDLFYLPTGLRAFHRPGVVLVGDSAHAMLPSLGQGGNATLEDAATLAILVEGRRLEIALERYDDERIHRTQKLQRMSHRIAMTTIHSRARVRVAARNGLYNLTPTIFAEIAGDWMLQWRPPRRTR